MPFNLNEFKSTVNKFGGPARKNLYTVALDNVPVSTSGMGAQDLQFFCQSATAPGINFTVADYYPNGFGVKQSIPVATAPDQFNAVFMLDSDHMILSFFHQWMQSVINYNYAQGPFSQINDQLPFEVGYKDDFSADITIRHYSTSNQNQYYEYKLYGAYPTQISGVDLSYSDNDSYATATINFSYEHMSTSGVIQGSPTERYARGTGLLDLINRLGTPAQVIGQNSLPQTIQDAINSYTQIRSGIAIAKNGFSQIRNIIK